MATTRQGAALVIPVRGPVSSDFADLCVLDETRRKGDGRLIGTPIDSSIPLYDRWSRRLGHEGSPAQIRGCHLWQRTTAVAFSRRRSCGWCGTSIVNADRGVERLHEVRLRCRHRQDPRRERARSAFRRGSRPTSDRAWSRAQGAERFIRSAYPLSLRNRSGSFMVRIAAIAACLSAWVS